MKTSTHALLIFCGGLMLTATITGWMNYTTDAAAGQYKYLYKKKPIEMEHHTTINDLTVEDFSRGEIKGSVKQAPMAERNRNTEDSETNKNQITKKLGKLKLKSFSRGAIEDIILDTAAEQINIIDTNAINPSKEIKEIE